MKYSIVTDGQVLARAQQSAWRTMLLILIGAIFYLIFLRLGLPRIGGQAVVSGYLLAGIVAWLLGVRGGLIFAILAMIITGLMVTSVPETADTPPLRAFIGVFLFLAFGLFPGLVSNSLLLVNELRDALEEEHNKSELLLQNILPVSIAQRLKSGEKLIADTYEDTSLLFCDIVGFTALTNQMKPVDLVELLNEIVSAFDEAASEFGIEKIKTIGDAYLVVGGLPEARPDHAQIMVRMGLKMIEIIENINKVRKDDEDNIIDLELRIGLHSGPVIGGVIGRNKFTFDMWGETVNMAARLETNGVPGTIHISETTHNLLQNEQDLSFEFCGHTELKGFGKRPTWLVKSKA